MQRLVLTVGARPRHPQTRPHFLPLGASRRPPLSPASVPRARRRLSYDSDWSVTHAVSKVTNAGLVLQLVEFTAAPGRNEGCNLPKGLEVIVTAVRPHIAELSLSLRSLALYTETMEPQVQPPRRLLGTNVYWWLLWEM